ncbi:hypothetical protein [Williamsia sp. 1138]|uniref:hypothetical protein n=1 Tax=Williamsia sp. 1138 TaxID=1903117 RepID=UPI001AEF982E|nr:hypothetical protein [Williamsia sp. 1138]
MSAPSRSWRAPATVLAGLVGACALCCAGPLLAILGGIGVAGLAGSLWLPALLMVVAVAAAAGIVLELGRRRRAGACTSSPAGPVDLDSPTIPTRDR